MWPKWRSTGRAVRLSSTMANKSIPSHLIMWRTMHWRWNQLQTSSVQGLPAWSGKCLHSSPRLHYHPGSSGWSPWLWWIEDESEFTEQVPIILGTPTIGCIVNVMNDKEMDALVMLWANARVAQLLSICGATATVLEDQTLESANLNGYDEVVFTRNAETIEAFSS